MKDLESNGDMSQYRRETDTATSTDMPGQEVTSIPEVQIDAKGVTSTLKISATSIVSGVPKVSKSSG